MYESKGKYESWNRSSISKLTLCYRVQNPNTNTSLLLVSWNVVLPLQIWLCYAIATIGFVCNFVYLFYLAVYSLTITFTFHSWYVHSSTNILSKHLVILSIICAPSLYCLVSENKIFFQIVHKLFNVNNY